MGKEPRLSKKLRAHHVYPYAPVKPTPFTSTRKSQKHLRSLGCLDDLFDYAGPDRPLKHLNFVRDTSDFYVHKSVEAASSLYFTGRSFAPAGLHSSIEKVEDKVAQVGGPMVGRILKAIHVRRERAFRLMDRQVERVFSFTHSCLVPPSKLENCKGVEQETAPAGLQQKMADVVSFVGEHGVGGSISLVIKEKYGLMPNEDDLGRALVIAWERMTAVPGATLLLETARPAVEYLEGKYLSAHDALVSSQAYHQALDLAAVVLSRAQQTLPYKVASDRLYPLLSPVVAPVLGRLASSGLYLMLLEHLRPHAMSTAPPAIADSPQWMAHSVAHIALCA